MKQGQVDPMPQQREGVKCRFGGISYRIGEKSGEQFGVAERGADVTCPGCGRTVKLRQHVHGSNYVMILAHNTRAQAA